MPEYTELSTQTLIDVLLLEGDPLLTEAARRLLEAHEEIARLERVVHAATNDWKGRQCQI